ncbi:MAG: TRAP transporter small permease [Clostridiales Family XIII bacterium]|jgi:TRAP-type C4-dicarboxylate transport system permease small subunit|nr:TRAP transporter small permease [Clostridiales Family XIII bacterium]
MSALNKIVGRCALALVGIAGLLLLLLLLAVFFATLSRYMFNKPFAFLIDYSAYSLLYITFLSAPWLYKNKGHVNIELITDYFPAKFKRNWYGVLDIVVIIIAVVMFTVSFNLTKSNIINNIRVADFLDTPKWLLIVPIPVSMVVLAFQAFLNMLKNFGMNIGMKIGAE